MNLEELKKQISELQRKVAKLENENKKEEKQENKKGIKRWRAKINDKYLYVDDSGDVWGCNDYNEYEDIYRYKIRNYFKTEEEAEEYQEIINTYYDLMDLAEELNNGEKIDWNDGSQYKYSIYYSYEIDTLKGTCSLRSKDLGQIYCLNINFKEKAIEKIGEDKLKKLFTYERN